MPLATFLHLQGKPECGHLRTDRFCLRCAEEQLHKQATAHDVASALADAAAGVASIASSAFPDLLPRCVG